MSQQVISYHSCGESMNDFSCKAQGHRSGRDNLPLRTGKDPSRPSPWPFSSGLANSSPAPSYVACFPATPDCLFAAPEASVPSERAETLLDSHQPALSSTIPQQLVRSFTRRIIEISSTPSAIGMEEIRNTGRAEPRESKLRPTQR